MRLTLRTLLAYMDDILDPADQEDLGRKIESSPFATELIHRSRDAVRRLRLSAPEVLAGSGDGVLDNDHNLDANTAAEYLDNTLAPEAVAEFERSCLEAGPHADMLLAEAASCHHVLTMVLGEPAEVDADLRQRMYALAEKHAGQQLRIEPAHSAPGQTAAMAAAPAPAARRGIDAEEAAAPDFMLAAAREERRAQRRTWTILAVAALLGGIAAWIFWPPGEVETPKDMAGMNDVDKIAQGGVDVDVVAGGAETASTADAADSSTAGDEAPPFTGSAATSETEAPAFTESTEPVPGSTVAVPSVEVPPEVTEDTPPAIPAEAVAADQTAAAAAAEASAVTPPPPPTADAATLPAIDAAAEAAMAETAPPLNTEPPVATTNITPGDAPPLPPQTPAGDATAEMAAAEASAVPAEGFTDSAAAPPATGVDPAAPRQLGAYLGNNDILLRFDAALGQWVRLPPRSAVTPGDRLLSLPTFRTHVVLADVNAYLAGGAELDLLPAAGDGAGACRAFGQLILNAGLNGNRVELTVGDQARAINLGPSSSLAIEVRRVFIPGAVVGQEPAPTQISWYLTSGKADWTGGAEAASAEAPATWVTVDGEDGIPAAIEELPKWVDESTISPNERRAREAVDEALAAGEPVNVRILELADPTTRGRLTEVRALAAKSGAYVGQFDPLVKALGDVGQRASWEDQIRTLRDAIARDPAAADAIRSSFASERGEKAAADLMEMLIGFDATAVGKTREEVQQGALVRLFRWMDDEDLTYRILASYNVNEILGTNFLGGYRPQHTAAQRTRELRHYWERLERGELMPKAEGAAP